MYSKQHKTCNPMHDMKHLSMYNRRCRCVRQHAQHGVHQRALQGSLQCTFVYSLILRCTCNAKNTTAAVHQHHMRSTLRTTSQRTPQRTHQKALRRFRMYTKCRCSSPRSTSALHAQYTTTHASTYLARYTHMHSRLSGCTYQNCGSTWELRAQHMK